MDRLKGKVAIVTGGGAGIGRRIAEVFAEEGAKVAVMTRSDNGIETVDGIIKAGGEAKFWKVDVADEAQVVKAVDEVAETYGTIDILVNNAGIQSVDKMMHECTMEEWKAPFEVDVHGVFYMNKHVVPYMLKQHAGSVVNISSIQGLLGAFNEQNSPYHACKAAVFGMTRQDACMYGPLGIRFNSVHPAAIDTPMVRKRLAPDVFKAYMQKEADSYPLRRIGDVDDVAYATLYLASDEAKFITGVQLPVDGGFYAY